jgi:hypothetical protein
MANTRFSGNILYGNAGFLRDLPMGASPDYVTRFDDFTAVAIDSTNAWTVVKDSGAAVAIVADTAGGELALTSAATTNDDGASIQGNEIFLPASGRTIWFMARVKNTSPADADMFFGLSENFATNPEAILSATSFIGFEVDDGAATILCKTKATTATTTTTAVSMVADTYINLAFKVMGTGLVQFYINGNLVASHTTYIPTTELALAAFSLSGSVTGTRVTTLDYIGAVATR